MCTNWVQLLAFSFISCINSGKLSTFPSLSSLISKMAKVLVSNQAVMIKKKKNAATEFLCPPKSTGWYPNPQGEGIWIHGLWVVIRSQEQSPHGGISVLIKGNRGRLASSPSYVRTQQEGCCPQTRKEPSVTSSTATMILDYKKSMLC